MNDYPPDAVLSPLLAADEPPAWQLINPTAPTPLLLLCDHASNRIPRQLQQLGLEPAQLRQHIAYDIGCKPLSTRLAELFNAPALLAGYSRLVVDLNRHPGDGSAMPELSDNVIIPGNHGLSREQIVQREQALFWPYHDRIEEWIDAQLAAGQRPVLCSIHSFTPVFRNHQRPWHIGVLWDRDRRISEPLLQRLRRLEDICVGDNEPYHARNPVGYSMDVHAERRGLPHVLLEIRQDLIEHPQGVETWAQLIYRELGAVLGQWERQP